MLGMTFSEIGLFLFIFGLVYGAGVIPRWGAALDGDGRELHLQGARSNGARWALARDLLEQVP